MNILQKVVKILTTTNWPDIVGWLKLSAVNLWLTTGQIL